MHWEEWDGEGMEHAVAWTPDEIYDELTIRRAVHRLGIEIDSREERFVTVHGFVTDFSDPDAEEIVPCGYTEKVEGSVPATFVFVVPRD